MCFFFFFFFKKIQSGFDAEVDTQNWDVTERLKDVRFQLLSLHFIFPSFSHL
jgi:hypothetical protein